MNLPVTCNHCHIHSHIAPLSAHLFHAGEWWIRWTCHAEITPGAFCDALNDQQVPRGHVVWYRDVGVETLTHPALLHEHRQDVTTPFTEDEYLNLAAAIHAVDHLSALAARRLEPEAVR